MYDFVAQNADDLSFKKDDVITVIGEEEGEEWLKVREKKKKKDRQKKNKKKKNRIEKEKKTKREKKEN